MDFADPEGRDPVIMYMKAGALRGLNKYRESLSLLEQLVKSDPSDVRYLVEAAGCCSELGDYRTAREYLSGALRIQPGNPYLVRQIADAYFHEKDYGQAKEHYLQVYADDPGFYLARQLARSYENLGLAGTAVLYYRTALEMNPADYKSTFRLANIYRRQEQYVEGIFLTDSYLESDSNNIEMLKLNAFLYFLKEYYSAAVKRIEYCHSLGDTSEFLNKYLGYSYFKTDAYAEAKTFLEKAWLEDTLNADLCYILGLSCDYSYYKEQAIEYLEKTIRLITPAPEHVSRVYQDLAKAQTGYYKYDDALDAYHKALELTPADTLLIFQLASHYDNWIKDKRMALQYYEKFMDTRPAQKKPLPKIPAEGGITLSYYDYVERRIKEIREEIFWEGNEPEKDIP
jgi:tetratricopeptide (TPR) repeat protein